MRASFEPEEAPRRTARFKSACMKIERYIVTGAAAGAVIVCCFQVASAKGLKHAEELFRRKDYERARRELAADTTSLAGESLDEALLMLARLETDSGRAERSYRRLMRSANKNIAVEARMELANLAYASGNYADALAILDAGGVRGGGREGLAFPYLRGLCCRQLGENARARAELATVTRGEYATWSALALAEIDMLEGKKADAIRRLEDIERRQTNPIVSFKLGEYYEGAGEKDRAIGAYRAIAERFPRSLEAAKGKEKLLLLEQKAPANAAGGGEGGERGNRRSKSARTEVSAVRGFTIQFGSFSARPNAVAVAGKLDKVLPAVRVESVEIEGRIWHRVRAGFYESTEAAAADASRAKERLGISGEVIPLK